MIILIGNMMREDIQEGSKSTILSQSEQDERVETKNTIMSVKIKDLRLIEAKIEKELKGREENKTEMTVKVQEKMTKNMKEETRRKWTMIKRSSGDSIDHFKEKLRKEKKGEKIKGKKRDQKFAHRNVRKEDLRKERIKKKLKGTIEKKRGTIVKENRVGLLKTNKKSMKNMKEVRCTSLKIEDITSKKTIREGNKEKTKNIQELTNLNIKISRSRLTMFVVSKLVKRGINFTL